MNLRKLVGLACALLLLSGCAQASPDAHQSMEMSAPVSCEIPGLVSAFDAAVPGSQYVPTAWQPSEGTDLYDAINSGGIACSYGIQVAEVGGTVLFGNLDLAQWEKKKAQWLQAGQIAVDLPGIDENDAVMLKEGSTGADEMHIWGVNLFIHGVWIQVNASFLQNLDEALPIIEAAISALAQ